VHHASTGTCVCKDEYLKLVWINGKPQCKPPCAHEAGLVHGPDGKCKCKDPEAVEKKDSYGLVIACHPKCDHGLEYDEEAGKCVCVEEDYKLVWIKGKPVCKPPCDAEAGL
ncbi:unnamed protein product, partial [Ostreobium quekettii]